MLYVPVNSQVYVGTLPPLHGTFTPNDDVITSNKCLKYPSDQAKKAYRYGGFDLKPLQRITSNQMVTQQRRSFAWRHKQPIYFFRPQWVVAYIDDRPTCIMLTMICDLYAKTSFIHWTFWSSLGSESPKILVFT